MNSYLWRNIHTNVNDVYHCHEVENEKSQTLIYKTMNKYASSFDCCSNKSIRVASIALPRPLGVHIFIYAYYTRGCFVLFSSALCISDLNVPFTEIWRQCVLPGVIVSRGCRRQSGVALGFGGWGNQTRGRRWLIARAGCRRGVRGWRVFVDLKIKQRKNKTHCYGSIVFVIDV